MIDRVNNLNNDDYLQRLRNADKKKANAYKNTEKRSVLSNSLSSEGNDIVDKLNISSEAKEATQIQNFAKTLKDLPEVRESLVNQAKQDLDSGVLDSKETIENTVDTLIKNIF